MQAIAYRGEKGKKKKVPLFTPRTAFSLSPQSPFMMAGNAGFGDEPLAPGRYSPLLFSDENSGLESDGFFGFAPTFSSDENVNAPKMLCFGEYAKQCGKKTGQKPGSACMDPSSENISKKRNGSVMEDPGDCAGAPTGRRRNGKKPKSENASVGGHAKVVKKEKLGERITALQQLVSPFGKTDTASVLHEALGYIKFLHDQVQVLCSPYLQCRSSSSPEAPHCPDDGGRKKSERSNNDLRSKGLCLVPVDLTVHVADSNGADLWSSTAMVDTVLSS